MFCCQDNAAFLSEVVQFSTLPAINIAPRLAKVQANLMRDIYGEGSIDRMVMSYRVLSSYVLEHISTLTTTNQETNNITTVYSFIRWFHKWPKSCDFTEMGTSASRSQKLLGPYRLSSQSLSYLDNLSNWLTS